MKYKVKMFVFITISIFLAIRVSHTAPTAEQSSPDFALNSSYLGSLESFLNLDSCFDSLNVRFIGNWPFGSSSIAVAHDSTRNLVFLGSGGGVYILEVSNPQYPIKLSELIHTRSFICDLFYMDSIQRLFIADYFCGLEIWDIADPVSPEKLGRCDTPGRARGVYVQDTYAYVVVSESLCIIDISVPTNPQEVGSCDIDRVKMGSALEFRN